MKLFLILFACFSFSSTVLAQQLPSPPVIYNEIDESYDIEKDTIQLEEIIVSKEKIDPAARKQFLILQNRVYVTYPYAKLTAERLIALNKGMDRLTTNKEKKKYFKIVEDYLTNEFEARLKKLSRSQGRILVRLIHRQTGSTTFELIKSLKSGLKAFMSNTTASIFDIDLKSKYQPFENKEDYLIENILNRAFLSGRLQNQPPINPININDLSEHWLLKNE